MAIIYFLLVERLVLLSPLRPALLRLLLDGGYQILDLKYLYAFCYLKPAARQQFQIIEDYFITYLAPVPCDVGFLHLVHYQVGEILLLFAFVEMDSRTNHQLYYSSVVKKPYVPLTIGNLIGFCN